MTELLRIVFSEAVYHITSRGNAKQEIFLDKSDFTDFFNLLYQVVKNTTKDITEYIGVCYATVSRAVR